MPAGADRRALPRRRRSRDGLSGDLLVQRRWVVTVNLDFQHCASHSSSARCPSAAPRSNDQPTVERPPWSDTPDAGSDRRGTGAPAPAPWRGYGCDGLLAAGVVRGVFCSPSWAAVEDRNPVARAGAQRDGSPAKDRETSYQHPCLSARKRALQGAPSKSLLSILGVLRRPATAADVGPATHESPDGGNESDVVRPLHTPHAFCGRRFLLHLPRHPRWLRRGCIYA